MSAAKHEELKREGMLNEDGTRPQVCPTCGQDVPEGVIVQGSAVAEPEPAVAGVVDPSQEA